VVLVLVVESRASSPLELRFDGVDRISIGRDPRSDVQLPEVSVSLRHALIRLGVGGYVLVDENSTNGTFLNATRLVPGSSTLLGDGDEIGIGRARLRVFFRSPTEVPEAAFSTQDIALAMVQGALIQSGSAVAPRVKVVNGPDRGMELVLRDERSYVLGRDADVDLKLLDEDASRRHTRIVRRGSRLWVVDLGSKNGTRLDGRRLRPNLAEAWNDTVMLELGSNQLAIDDPVSSALRDLEKAPDEKLGSEWPARGGAAVADFRAAQYASQVPAATVRHSGAKSGVGFSSVSESKGALSLSTSSSSSAPSAPIEVLQLRQTEPVRAAAPRSSWSTLDLLVLGVAVLTLALSALALAWFLAN
jgi:pSer/pThr/pTyr-binding forkhead associated (FHA) protein